MDGVIFSGREHFIQLVLLADTEKCILWPYAVRKSTGYGAHNTPGPHDQRRNVDAHNYVCRLAHGEPEPGEEAAHSCGVKLCVNPRHLSWKYPIDNMLDAIQHGTLKGGGIYRQRFFAEEIAELVRSPESHLVLAQRYGVDQAYIGRLRRRAGWRQPETPTQDKEFG